MKDEINEFGIFLTDIFILDYYGIKTFFQVCGTTKKTVFLIELAQKEIGGKTMLSKNLVASKNPKVVRNMNVWTKSRYEVTPINLNGNEYWLPIPIKIGDPLFNEALKYTEFPSVGYAYAVKVNDVANKYWEPPMKKEKINLA